jgi:hypothetical protein
MSERSLEALHAALAILSQPLLLRPARRSPLPKGITLLLEIAAGDPDAIREAQAATNSSEALLTEAAVFFTEQVILCRKNNSYRILGADSSASPSELRRHMALILRWLHPDAFAGDGDGGHFDKTALASLVTGAWETIKTGDRRAAYDAALAIEAKSTQRHASRSAEISSATAASSRSSSRSPVKLALYKIERDPFWIRILCYLGRLK